MASAKDVFTRRFRSYAKSQEMAAEDVILNTSNWGYFFGVWVQNKWEQYAREKHNMVLIGHEYRAAFVHKNQRWFDDWLEEHTGA